MENDERKLEPEVVVVQCRTENEKGTSCSVNGEGVEDGPVEAIIRSGNLSGEEGREVLYRNTFSRRIWSLADYLVSNPKLEQKVKWAESSTFGGLKMFTKKITRRLLP